MDYSELGEPFQNFIIKFIEPSEYDATLKVLEDYLYISIEPIGYRPEFSEDFNTLFATMFRKGDNLSYMAVDSETGEIAALRKIDLNKKDGPPGGGYLPMKHKSIIDFFQVCTNLCKNEDLYGKYNITQYAEMFGLCVTHKYRQRGLATEMYTRGLDFMRNRGFKIVKCMFVSPYSRKAGYKHGYKEFSRAKFIDLRNSEGNIINPNADPDQFICFGVFYSLKLKSKWE